MSIDINSRKSIFASLNAINYQNIGNSASSKSVTGQNLFNSYNASSIRDNLFEKFGNKKTPDKILDFIDKLNRNQSGDKAGDKTSDNLNTPIKDNPAVNSGDKVIVIDDFKNTLIDIDGDSVNDLSHGETVARTIESGNNINVERLNVAEEGDDSLSTDRIISALENIQTRVNNGEKIDGVNMSMAVEKSLTDLSKELGIDLNKINIDDYGDEIRQYISDNSQIQGRKGTGGNSDSSKYSSINDIITLVESLANKGVKVTMASGNGGSNTVNMLSFAGGETKLDKNSPFNNIHIVGATNANNKVTSYSSNGETDYAQGSLAVDKIDGTSDFNSDGVINASDSGYDWTYDGIPDVFNYEVSSGGSRGKYNGDQVGTIFGTSYAAPTEMRNLILSA